jgi:hypothetical protein
MVQQMDTRTTAKRETFSLIGSDKVEGTSVYNPKGEDLGHIERVMIDKKGGQVVYAVLSFGGFLGMGKKYHPLPWSLLKYDTNKGGYIVNLDKKLLEGAPTFDEGSEPNWEDREWGRRLDEYYGMPLL